jgi:hypothetical protein
LGAGQIYLLLPKGNFAITKRMKEVLKFKRFFGSVLPVILSGSEICCLMSWEEDQLQETDKKGMRK